MKYSTGAVGRVVVARFDEGEDFLTSLMDIARKEDLRSAVFFLVGGAKGGNMVLGPKGDEMPPEPVWHRIAGNHEMLGVGTIFWDGKGPRAHLHSAVGRGEDVRVGCIRQDSKTFLVLEAVILEITGIEAKRELDPASGLALLKLI